MTLPDKNDVAIEDEKSSVPLYATFILASLYVLSGVTQPILMNTAKDAGLADRKCQLYMFFYYLGPASVTITLINNRRFWKDSRPSSSWKTLLKAAFIAVIDIFAQTMNYTGSIMAGPTLFAIIYSSVTIWTAVMSRILLQRHMNICQWSGVTLVFGGLTITGLNSVSLGPQVFHGSVLVIIGSAVHSLTYVLSEAIMTKGEKLPMPTNCAVQGNVACSAYLFWQVIYTRHHFQELLIQPMKAANTTFAQASIIFFGIYVANLIHALTFFHTLKHFPGGATSAGVMKGLQAVLVFVATNWLFCGRIGGMEMCFSRDKLISLIVVVGGVLIFGKATTYQMKQIKDDSISAHAKINDGKGDGLSRNLEVSSLLTR